MADWSFAIGNHQLLAPEYPLDVDSPSLTFYLSGQAHEFSGTLSGDSPVAQFIRPLVQDVWGYRDKKLVFRGPLLDAAPTGDADGISFALTANSYRARIARWLIPTPTSSTTGMTSLGAAASAPGFAWRAINLNLPTSDLAGIITDKHVTAGPASSQSAQGGTATDAVIDTLTQVFAFDWDFVPNANGTVEFTTWTPRGIQRPEQRLLYGKPGSRGSNCTFTRTLDFGSFANVVSLVGQDASGNPISAKASTPFGPEGLWMSAGDASSTTDTAGSLAQLQTQANNQLVTAETPTPSYTITPTEGWWQGPDQIWLGDSPQLVINAPPLDVDDLIRVQQISVSPADGAEGAQFTVGAKPIGKTGQFALVRTFRNIDKRIRAIEWHQ